MNTLRLSFLLLAAGPAIAAPPPETTKLSGPLVSGGTVWDYKTSPDGKWVVYHADQEVDQQNDIYRVAAGGGAAIKLSADLPAGGDVLFSSSYEIAPDSSRVVYLADQELDGHFDLYSVLLVDGSRIKLSNPDFAAQAGAFLITPDSTRVVYVEAGTLYVQPIGGGGRTALTTGTPIAITPDSLELIFQQTTPELRYFGIPLAGGSPTLLFDPPNDASFTTPMIPSPDSTRVLFERQQSSAPIPSGRYDVLSSSTLSSGTHHEYYRVSGSCCSIAFSGVTPVPVDGAHRVIWADNSGLGDLQQELYSEPLEGGAQTVLATIPYPNPIQAQITADPTAVLYRGGHLFKVPVTGGSSLDLSGALVAGGEITDFTSSTDAGWVVYRADQTVDDVFDLHATPLAGGTPDNLTDSSGAIDVQPDFALASGSNAVVYRADPYVDEQQELLSVAVVGGPRLQLSSIQPAGGDVVEDGWSVTGDGRHVIYLADQETDGVVELFSARLRTACAGGFTEEDGDGVCSADNCPATHNPSQVDDDGDGAGDACDCAPADADVRRPPEIPGMLAERLGTGSVRLSWPSVIGADSYALTRGLLSALAPGQYGDCLVIGVADTFYDDGDEPGDDQGFAYLVQGVSVSCGPGPFGQGAGGERINEDPQACYAP